MTISGHNKTQMLDNISVFVGFVPANREIWAIGDKYMMFVAQHLDYWKEVARKNPHEALYILHWYDVKAFPPQSTSTNAIEVILSTLIGALNNRPKLPDVLVVMLGDTKFWCNEQALQFTMDTLLTVLISEIKRILETRQGDLPVKAQGPETKLFFVKLNWKPDKAVDSVPFYPKKRRTFNKLLDAITRPRGASTILLHEINDKLDPDLFLCHGELSPKGYRQVWSSLSEAIRDFKFKGHQKKKVYSLMAMQTASAARISDVDSSLYSSDDDQLTHHEQDNKWKFLPKLQTRRTKSNHRKGDGGKRTSHWNYNNSKDYFF